MKRNKIIFWLTTGFMFAFEGLMPLSTLLFATQYFNAGTKPLGYPDYFAYALIIFKVLGATALIIPKLPSRVTEWAYAGLAFNLIFAVISHGVVDGTIGSILTPVLVGGMLTLSYIYNLKIRTGGQIRLQTIDEYHRSQTH